MKSTALISKFPSVLPVILCATLLSMWVVPAGAITLPVAENSSTATVKGSEVVRSTAAKKPFLSVAPGQRALVRFALSNPDVLPENVEPANVTSAALRLYVLSARNPAGGNLVVRKITGPWSEGADSPAPPLDPVPVATIPAADIRSKGFISIDVTAAVLAELGTGDDFGFAIESSDPGMRVTLASKGGSLAGASACLVINSDPLINTPGNANLFIGPAGASLSTTGSENTASGVNALYSNTTGSFNTASGRNALYSNTSGSDNTASGRDALYFNTTGFFNTASGRGALYANTSGSDNTASGVFALASNTSGSANTASGRNALLANTIGSDNTASGVDALYSNTTGSANTASGRNALYSNTTGSDNAASGHNALYSNTTGSANAASGRNALYSNTTGFFNTASGVFALASSTSGSSNTASGHNALWANTTGSDNTAIGSYALDTNTTGSSNIAMGKNAGRNLTTGSNNIAIGHQGVAAESSTLRIGTAGFQNRTFVAGIRGVTTGANNAVPVLIDASGQLGTVSSSRRYKEDIGEMGIASSRLLALRPVTFRYREPFAAGEKPQQYGLIAEEVAQAFPELAVFNDQGQPETVKYQDLAVILLNEFLKAHATVEQQSRLIAGQAAQISQQNAQILELQRTVTATAERTEALARQIEGKNYQAAAHTANVDAGEAIPGL